MHTENCSDSEPHRTPQLNVTTPDSELTLTWMLTLSLPSSLSLSSLWKWLEQTPQNKLETRKNGCTKNPKTNKQTDLTTNDHSQTTNVTKNPARPSFYGYGHGYA